jgi:hypothetical protein
VDASHLLLAFDSLHWTCTAYTTFDMLCNRQQILIVCLKGINELQILCGRFKAVEIIKFSYVVSS